MSLVRSTKSSNPLERISKNYALNDRDDSSGSTTHILGSDQVSKMYSNDFQSDDDYEKYLFDSMADMAAELNEASSLSFMNSQPFDSSYDSSGNLNTYHSDSESPCLQDLIPDPVYYDEIQIRLQLQELERVLLGDNDFADCDMFISQSSEISTESINPIQNALTQISYEEFPSSDSARIPQKLLLDCAELLSKGNIEGASGMIPELRQMVSIQGDPPQRIAAYMVEGLAARIAASGKCLYKALKCKEPPSSDRLAAMQILFEVCPCFKFGFMAANGAIIEASENESRVHIVDFDINQGTQYITLIQMLANRQVGKSQHFRLTGIDDPESIQRSVGGLKIIGQRLEELAEVLGVSFEFRAVASKTSIVTPSILECRPDEALIVNFAFQLHHMPDESVSTLNLRDQLLRMVKSLNPKVVTVVEQDVNTNTAPFFPRFMDAYSYYSAVFESLDTTIPRESQDRMNVERHCLARDIVNIVACEGEERIERYEVAGKWRARLTMAGFVSCPMSSDIIKSIRDLIREYCEKYKVKEEKGALHFGWQDKSLIVASAWR